MLKVFKITHAGKQRKSPELIGLLIIQASDGFYLVSTEAGLEPPRIVAKSNLAGQPGKPPLVTFDDFEYKKAIWTLVVTASSPGGMNGIWKSPPRDPAQEEDGWTATGTGTSEPEGDDAKTAYAS